MPRIPVSTKCRLQTGYKMKTRYKMQTAEWVQNALPNILIQNFSTHSRREGTITMIVLQCTGLHFLSNHYPPFSQHD